MALARRDQCPLIALHTTPVMVAAHHLYRKEGFEVVRELPDMSMPFSATTDRVLARITTVPSSKGVKTTRSCASRPIALQMSAGMVT
jgi:hypothetical protein